MGRSTRKALLFAVAKSDSFLGTATNSRKRCLRDQKAGWEEKPKGRQVLRTEVASGSQVRNEQDGAAQGGCHAELPVGSVGNALGLPFAATAKAQVEAGVGVGPAVVTLLLSTVPRYATGAITTITLMPAPPMAITGLSWFNGGVFIGVGPWYGWGWRMAGEVAADTAIAADTEGAADTADAALCWSRSLCRRRGSRICRRSRRG